MRPMQCADKTSMPHVTYPETEAEKEIRTPLPDSRQASRPLSPSSGVFYCHLAFDCMGPL